MARQSQRHVRLDMLARKLLAEASRPSVRLDSPPSYDALLTRLRQERLDLTDLAFRARYGRWL